ncbi:MAG: L-lactate permease [Pseudomonadota bacterium]
MATLYAAAPLCAVLVAMVAFRLSAAAAGTAGLLIAAGLAATAFAPDVVADPAGARLAIGVAAEAAHATGTILWIIFPALTLYEYQRRSGGLARMRKALVSLTDDRRLQVLLIAWFFGLFMEGAAGFGTPVALAAPLLVGIGLAPVRAVALALLGHAAGVAFGAVGTPALTQVEITGLDPIALAGATSSLTVVAGVVLLVALVRTADPKALSIADIGWAALAGLAFFLPHLAFAMIAGPELPTLAGALIGFAVFLTAIRAVGAAGPLATHGLAADLAPYLGLVALVLATRLVLPVAEALDSVRLTWSMDGAFGASLAPLTHPGTAMMLCVVVTGTMSGRAGLLVDALSAALRRLLPVALALLIMLLLSRLMVHAGMIDALAAAAARTGAFWPLLAPVIGTLGTFVTGSATASSVLFAEFQSATASALGLAPALMMAAQGLGGAIGNVLAPHNIVAGAATVGLDRQEGSVLRLTAPGAALALAATGATVAVIAML